MRIREPNHNHEYMGSCFLHGILDGCLFLLRYLPFDSVAPSGLCCLTSVAGVTPFGLTTCLLSDTPYGVCGLFASIPGVHLPSVICRPAGLVVCLHPYRGFTSRLLSAVPRGYVGLRLLQGFVSGGNCTTCLLSDAPTGLTIPYFLKGGLRTLPRSSADSGCSRT